MSTETDRWRLGPIDRQSEGMRWIIPVTGLAMVAVTIAPGGGRGNDYSGHRRGDVGMSTETDRWRLGPIDRQSEGMRWIIPVTGLAMVAATIAPGG